MAAGRSLQTSERDRLPNFLQMLVAPGDPQQTRPQAGPLIPDGFGSSSPALTPDHTAEVCVWEERSGGYEIARDRSGRSRGGRYIDPYASRPYRTEKWARAPSAWSAQGPRERGAQCVRKEPRLLLISNFGTRVLRYAEKRKGKRKSLHMLE